MTNAPTTRTADHTELARLAEAATPGPWFASDWDVDDGENLWTIEAREPEVLSPGQSSIWPGGVRCKRIAQTEEGENPTEDAAFIAATNPATVLSLLSEIAALRGDLTETRVAADLLVSSVRADLRQAERQRDEAFELLREIKRADIHQEGDDIDNHVAGASHHSRAWIGPVGLKIRAFLANQGADQ